MFKKCTGCGIEKPFEEFGKHRRGKFGLDEKCRICTRIRNKKTIRSKEAIEKNKKYKSEWQKENRKLLNERLRKRYKENLESSRELSKIRQTKYKKTEKGKLNKKKTDEKYAFENPERIEARHIFKYALRKGTVIRPKFCDICKKACTPQAHHEDYSKPLDVMWMCPKCHYYHHNQHRIYRDRLSEKTSKEDAKVRTNDESVRGRSEEVSPP